MDDKIREHLEVAKAETAKLIEDEGDAGVVKRVSTSVSAALEEMAKAEALTPEHRAILTTFAGLEVLKADMVVRLTIRNDPWQVETKQLEVPVGSSRAVPDSMFPDTTVHIAVPGVKKAAEETRWPGDMAAAKYDKDSGRFVPPPSRWGEDRKQR